MTLESLPRLITALLGFYVLLYAPGQTWWHGHTSVMPRAFARIALSAAWTSAVGIVLAASSAFSVPALFLCNAVATLFGYLLVGRRREEGVRRHTPAGLGAAITALALVVYWPAFQTHMAASDSSSYLAAGIRLARSGSLVTVDPLLAQLSDVEKRKLFPSIFGYSWKPPYSRMPGGMVVESLAGERVTSTFFPLPALWAAVFADLLGPSVAGGYAPVFAALALWACWIVMRTRAGPIACLAAIVVLALNAATYWAARFPLSEPLVWFFLWAGLAAHDAWEDEGLGADGFAMGVLFGATVLARPEYGLFIALAFFARPLAGAAVAVRRLPPAFYLGLAPLAAATACEIWIISGAYLAPLTDTISGIGYRLKLSAARAPLRWSAAAAVPAAITAVVLRRRGKAGLAALAAVASVPFYMVFASHSHLLRSWAWMHSYFGYLLPLSALIGAWIVYRERLLRSANAVLVLLLGIHALLVLYDPHVLPAMPWAARRFVPVIVPAMALFTAVAVSRISDRSRLAGAALAIVVFVTALAPARPLWGRAFYARGLDQVAEVAHRLPDDGIIVFDHSLATHVLGAPLWLLFGRTSLTLDLSVPENRWFLRGFALRRADTPVYLVSPIGPGGPQIRAAYTRLELIDEFSIQTRLPEQTGGSVPSRWQDFLTNLRVERVVPLKP